MAKQKLVENVLVPARLFEKVDTSLHEAVVGDKTYEILAVYRFPFTRPGQKNLNGRTYPHALWDRLFSMNITTVSLVNHPDDDGDPARIWAVMKNAGYNKDRTLGLVDCYIINNECGKTAMGVLAAGGDVGLSSSGLGDFEVDGETVAPDSYELERWADWVLSPSYSVFGKIDDKISEAISPDMEQDKSNNTTASATGLRENKAGADMKTLTLREKRELELSLKKIYEDVKEIKDIRERLSRAKEALTFYEGTDVDSYKGEFEELVKETEKEFESALAKAEQVDAVKKEADDTSRIAADAKKESEDLKKENDILKKENEDLKEQLKKSKDLEDYSAAMADSLAKTARHSVPYKKYEELRQYAVKATKLYSKLKDNYNLLQVKLQETQTAVKSFEEARMLEYRKDAAARTRIEELRQRNADAKTLAEIRLREAREREFMRNVNPDVMEYYNDLIRMGEKVEGIKMQILSKRTLLEAQMLVLQAKRKNAPVMESVPDRDLSAPLPVKNWRQVMPDIPMTIPKGFI